MSHTESDQARIGLNAVGGDSDGEFAPEETGIVHRTSPRGPPARIHPLAVYLRISLPSGEPVRPEGLSPEEWEDFIVSVGGVQPIRISIDTPTACLVDFPEAMDMINTVIRMFKCTNYFGTTISCSPMMEDKKSLVQRLQLDRQKANQLAALDRINALAVEKERSQQELEAFMERVQDKLVSLQENVDAVASNTSVKSPNNTNNNRTHDIRIKPIIGQFSGTIPVPKGEVGFKTWRHQILVALNTHPRQIVRTVMTSTITGTASSNYEFLGIDSTIEEILEDFQDRYLQKKSADVLRNEFHNIRQGPKDSIETLANSLEVAFTKLQEVDPSVTKDVLKERLFIGMTQRLRDSLRFIYDKPECTYKSLMAEARIIEAERSDTKTVTFAKSLNTVETGEGDQQDKGASASAMDIGDLSKSVSDVKTLMLKKLDGMTAQMKNLQSPSPKKGGNKNQNNREGESTPTKRDFGSRRNRNNNSSAIADDVDQSIVCFRCGGKGHMYKQCPTPGKDTGRGLSRAEPSPQKKEKKVPESK